MLTGKNRRAGKERQSGAERQVIATQVQHAWLRRRCTMASACGVQAAPAPLPVLPHVPPPCCQSGPSFPVRLQLPGRSVSAGLPAGFSPHVRGCCRSRRPGRQGRPRRLPPLLESFLLGRAGPAEQGAAILEQAWLAKPLTATAVRQPRFGDGAGKACWRTGERLF